MTIPILRPGTSDHAIWLNINENDEYRLEDMERWITSGVVIDIGAHIGAFTHACLKYNPARVYAYEPHPENAKLFRQNIRDYRVEFYEAAVVGKEVHWADKKISLMEWTTSPGEINTGAASLSSLPRINNKEGPDSYRVDFVQFDRVIYDAQKKGVVSLVKLDCEGAEFDIVMNSALTDIPLAYCGEYHDFSEMGIIENIRDRFASFGYSFEYFHHPDSHLGMFFAERKN